MIRFTVTRQTHRLARRSSIFFHVFTYNTVTILFTRVYTGFVRRLSTMPNPACFFDITIDKKPAGRICFEASNVFYQDAPCRMIQCHRLIEQKHNILNVWEHHIYIYSFIFWRSDGLSQSFMCNSHLISFQLYSIDLLTCYYTSVQRLT